MSGFRGLVAVAVQQLSDDEDDGVEEGSQRATGVQRVRTVLQTTQGELYGSGTVDEYREVGVFCL